MEVLDSQKVAYVELRHFECIQASVRSVLDVEAECGSEMQRG